MYLVSLVDDLAAQLPVIQTLAASASAPMCACGALRIPSGSYSHTCVRWLGRRLLDALVVIPSLPSPPSLSAAVVSAHCNWLAGPVHTLLTCLGGLTPFALFASPVASSSDVCAVSAESGGVVGAVSAVQAVSDDQRRWIQAQEWLTLALRTIDEAEAAAQAPVETTARAKAQLLADAQMLAEAQLQAEAEAAKAAQLTGQSQTTAAADLCVRPVKELTVRENQDVAQSVESLRMKLTLDTLSPAGGSLKSAAQTLTSPEREVNNTKLPSENIASKLMAFAKKPFDPQDSFFPAPEVSVKLKLFSDCLVSKSFPLGF